ncbi:unnamed protein product [Strongylus vulgaris]|uniref:Uncharacterized protein n=1 Tax=Strongylus vulgaris TaxID=40348 RepID=A0A3P7JUK3_STRVU|nr:unnamed protein product [Strongylus vulgaris]
MPGMTTKKLSCCHLLPLRTAVILQQVVLRQFLLSPHLLEVLERQADRSSHCFCLNERKRCHRAAAMKNMRIQEVCYLWIFWIKIIFFAIFSSGL